MKLVAESAFQVQNENRLVAFCQSLEAALICPGSSQLETFQQVLPAILVLEVEGSHKPFSEMMDF